jgi:hypothetical protein
MRERLVGRRAAWTVCAAAAAVLLGAATGCSRGDSVNAADKKAATNPSPGATAAPTGATGVLHGAPPKPGPDGGPP